MSEESCDPEVFRNGVSLGFANMTKEADNYCKHQTEKTGYKHDWHSFAGRVHIKALIPSVPDD